MPTILSTKSLAFLTAALVIVGVLSFSIPSAFAVTEVQLCVKNGGIVFVVGQGFKKSDCKASDQLISFDINNVGPQGPVGPAGPAGPAGPVGAIGPVGPVGPAGPQGAPGPTGAQGATGNPGPDGNAGAPGAQGPVGDAGPTGAAGPQGAPGPQGAEGPQGPAGPTGPAGPGGELGDPGPAGPPGPQGIQGPVGPQGPAGATGPEGEPGPQGPQGTPGDTGPAGAIGPTGPAGAQGVQGPTGPTGPAGNDGAAGAAGATGPAGPAGPQGVAGPQGPAGNDGAAGATGATGATGPAGPQGDPGAQGVAGPQGPVGPQGPSGVTIEADPIFVGSEANLFVSGDKAKLDATASAVDLAAEAAARTSADTGLQTNIDALFGSKTTDDLTEGTTNKYFSDTLARLAISGSAPVSYDSLTGVISIEDGAIGDAKINGLAWSKITGAPTFLTQFDEEDPIFTGSPAFGIGGADITNWNATISGLAAEITDRTAADTALQANIDALDTGDIVEGSNLYFTDARARLAISGSAPVSYDSLTGVISIDDGAIGDAKISGLDWSKINNAPDFITNLDETDPIFTGSDAFGISSGQITSWDATVTGLATEVAARAAADTVLQGNIDALDTDAVSEGATNLYFTDARFNSAFGAKTTDDLTEGANKYFSNSLARLAISGSAPISYDNSTGVISIADGAIGDEKISGLAWDKITGEPTFLTSFTELDPVFLVSAAHGISAGDITGWNATVTGLATEVAARAAADTALQGSINALFGTKTTTDLAEGTNKYFTDARARLSISGTAPISYDSATGIISIANGAIGDAKISGLAGSKITGAVPTATALAANGTNCTTPGQFALGVDASGNAEGCATPAGANGALVYTNTNSTPLTSPHVVTGSATIASGGSTNTVTVTLSGTGVPFTSNTSYVCTANSASTNTGTKITYTDGSHFVILGGSSDAVKYICVGN